MAGGALKGFGVVFIVLGSLAIVVGLAAAAFGAYMYNEEEGRGLFADRDKAEGGAILGVGGLAVAGGGAVLLLLGLVLYAVGASQARRELLQVAARGSAAGPPAAGPALPRETPLPAAPSARRAGPSPWVVGASVVGVAALLLTLLLLFQPSGLLGATGNGNDPAPEPQVETFEGTVQGVRAPVAGGSNLQPAVHAMTPRPDFHVGYLRGSLNWTAAPGSPASLVLILEAREGNEWVEKARGDGGPGLTVETPALTLSGSQVRARVFVGGAGAGSQGYALTLTLLPA